jgi:hypothetical protein
VKIVKSNQLHDNFSKLQFSRISKIPIKTQQVNQQFFLLFCKLLVLKISTLQEFAKTMRILTGKNSSRKTR